jgi:flavin reductase (DIM6/NTAB) family NADH-FMN oxidoreductase RutF
VAVVIDKATLTRELVEASGEFVLNVPARQQAALALAVGTQSGREVDKFGKVGAGGTAASIVGAPLVEGCLAWLECRVISEPHIEKTYDLFLAEVVAAWADPEAFSNDRWHFPDAQRCSIHYQAGGNFFATGEAFEA